MYLYYSIGIHLDTKPFFSLNNKSFFSDISVHILLRVVQSQPIYIYQASLAMYFKTHVKVLQLDHQAIHPNQSCVHFSSSLQLSLWTPYLSVILNGSHIVKSSIHTSSKTRKNFFPLILSQISSNRPCNVVMLGV